jgi:hypothetical protein
MEFDVPGAQQRRKKISHGVLCPAVRRRGEHILKIGTLKPSGAGIGGLRLEHPSTSASTGAAVSIRGAPLALDDEAEGVEVFGDAVHALHTQELRGGVRRRPDRGQMKMGEDLLDGGGEDAAHGGVQRSPASRTGVGLPRKMKTPSSIAFSMAAARSRLRSAARLSARRYWATT